MAESVFKNCKLIDPDKVRATGCFTSLPVWQHNREDIANAASLALIRDSGEFLQDGREMTSHCSMSALGNLCTFVYPETDPERLGLLTYMTDLGLMHDDACEEMSFEDAVTEHSELDSALDFEDKRILRKESKSAKTKKLASQVLLECIKLDQKQSIIMIDFYRKAWLAVMEHPNTDHIQTLDEYFYHRDKNIGIGGFWPMVNFGISFFPSKDDEALFTPARTSAERALMLTNDYYSWERERDQSQSQGEGRIFNAVWFIMRQDNVSETVALSTVKDMILKYEAEFAENKAKLYRDNPSLPFNLRVWIEGCGAVVAGNHYWCSHCPRHNNWKSKPPSPPSKRVTLSEISAMGRSGANSRSAGADTGSTKPKSTKANANGANGTKNSGTVINGNANADGDRKLNGLANHNPSLLEHQQSPAEWARPSPFSTPPHSPLRKQQKLLLDETHALAPCNYVSKLPSKGFRSALIEAFDIWLHVNPATVDIAKRTVDMLHNSSLVLDDIEDGSTLRRGKPAAHVIFGEAQSINSATFVYVNAVKLVYQMQSTQTMEALLEEIGNLFVGQGWDLYWKHHLLVPTAEEYLQMVDLKTGGLFRLLARLMLAGSQQASKLSATVDGEVNGDGNSTVDLSSLCCLLGRFFQIRDDYQNLHSVLYAEQKGFCEDFDEGKISYLVVYCCAQSPSHRDHVLGMFRSNATNGSMSAEGKRYVLSCLEETGSVQATRELLLELESGIEKEIDRLEESFGEENPVLRLLVASLSVKTEAV